MELNQTGSLGRNFFLYGLSYLLLLEWLMPLPQITDTGYMHVFVLFTAIFFLITFLQFPTWISILVKTFFILFGIHFIFFDISFLLVEWLMLFLLELQHNIQLIISGQWFGLTFLFRSLLFFILLAMMSYILFYWTIYAKRLLFFLVFTVLYVTIIDTFTMYDATFAIVRIFFVGFFLLGLLKMYRLVDEQRISLPSKYLVFRYAALVIVVMCIAVIAGFFGPKFGPQWDDPVPFIQTALGVDAGPGGTGGAGQQIGYSVNDERLGGGFSMNNEPVFFAEADRGYYWRGESKDFYNGKGWEVTTPEQQGEQSSYYEQYVDLETKNIEVTMVTDRQYNQLFYPGEFIEASFEGEVLPTLVDRNTGKAEAFQYGSPFTPPKYSAVIHSPTFPIERLRTKEQEDPEDIKQYYTQLPETLPARVGELAAEIVRNDTNRYEMVRRIEQYFSRSGFLYETSSVPYPGAEQDYVDQFLFETKRGYCDNYSSAMVVMLRTLDIPARWVKGFTQGERIEPVEDGKYLYEVTNENAHSWVEVYFPEVGWVPFEPTRGFSPSFDFSLDINEETVPSQQQEAPEIEAEETLAPIEEVENEGGSSGKMDWSFSSFPLMPFFLAVIVAAIGYVKRNKLLATIFIRLYGTRKSKNAFQSAFLCLIWFLQFYGCRKKEEETLREYAIRVDSLFSTNNMFLLTESYEKSMYGRVSSEQEWEKSRKLWEKLVRKIGS